VRTKRGRQTLLAHDAELGGKIASDSKVIAADALWAHVQSAVTVEVSDDSQRNEELIEER